ncbi:hypothetical protein HYU14_05595 [Candidatus Woesearchaeota archaeon]|nr:hypothetical protein [Candidatus Woesearchaeota archaeon]
MKSSRIFRKSQITLLDLLISFGMASLLIVIVVLGWNFYNGLLLAQQKEKFMELSAMQALDLLVKSPGEPVSWEDSAASAEVIGLASSDRNLSSKKVQAIGLLSYNATEKLLGIGLLDFQLTLRHRNGTALSTFGKSQPSNIPVISLQRHVLFENLPATIEMAVWE